MKIYQQFKKKLLKDKEVKKAYDELGAEFSLIEAGLNIKISLTEK